MYSSREFKNNYCVLMVCLLLVGQLVSAQTGLLVSEQEVFKQKEQVSKVSLLKKRVFSSTGAAVAFAVCCCALTYWCLQLHKGNAVLAEKVQDQGKTIGALSSQVNDQEKTLHEAVIRMNSFQKIFNGRLAQLEALSCGQQEPAINPVVPTPLVETAPVSSANPVEVKNVGGFASDVPVSGVVSAPNAGKPGDCNIM